MSKLITETRKDDKMKKIIISIIILLIFAGGAGYLGLVHIPPDQYGIIHTTIQGFDKEVYEPEKYLWRWEKLLPTVFSLYTFSLTPYRTDISSPVKGSLYPSGNDYAKALGEEFDFSFDISLSVEFAVEPDNLLELVENGLRPDTLSSWYEKISFKLSETLSSIIINDPEIFIKMTRKQALEKIQVILGDNKDFKGIHLLAVDPRNINIPDYDVYKVIKEKYFERLEERTAMKKELMDAEKSLYLEAIQKEITIIRDIEKYGDILTTYPAIMEYLHKTNKEYVQDALEVIDE